MARGGVWAVGRRSPRHGVMYAQSTPGVGDRGLVDERPARAAYAAASGWPKCHFRSIPEVGTYARPSPHRICADRQSTAPEFQKESPSRQTSRRVVVAPGAAHGQRAGERRKRVKRGALGLVGRRWVALVNEPSGAGWLVVSWLAMDTHAHGRGAEGGAGGAGGVGPPGRRALGHALASAGANARHDSWMREFYLGGRAVQGLKRLKSVLNALCHVSA